MVWSPLAPGLGASIRLCKIVSHSLPEPTANTIGFKTCKDYDPHQPTSIIAGTDHAWEGAGVVSNTGA